MAPAARTGGAPATTPAAANAGAAIRQRLRKPGHARDRRPAGMTPPLGDDCPGCRDATPALLTCVKCQKAHSVPGGTRAYPGRSSRGRWTNHVQGPAAAPSRRCSTAWRRPNHEPAPSHRPVGRRIPTHRAIPPRWSMTPPAAARSPARPLERMADDVRTAPQSPRAVRSVTRRLEVASRSMTTGRCMAAPSSPWDVSPLYWLPPWPPPPAGPT